MPPEPPAGLTQRPSRHLQARDRLLLSRGLVFPDWLSARPVADFYLDALGALEFYLVGVDCPAAFACARGFETPARLLLVFDRKPDVFETEPLSCRPHRRPSTPT